jgi:hypothetical protein
MQQIDSTVITTALPQMAISLHTDPVRFSVAVTAYLLSLAVFVPLSGWEADRFGGRTIFRVGNLLRSPLGGLFRSLLCDARSSEDASHGVIPLVTGVFVDGIPTLAHRNHCCPRSCPHRRIFDSELVEKRVSVGAREALDQVRVLARVGQAGFALEIRRVDNQRVSLPVAARVSLPLTNAPMGTPMQGNDASVVDHLVENHDIFGVWNS